MWIRNRSMWLDVGILQIVDGQTVEQLKSQIDGE